MVSKSQNSDSGDITHNKETWTHHLHWISIIPLLLYHASLEFRLRFSQEGGFTVGKTMACRRVRKTAGTFIEALLSLLLTQVAVKGVDFTNLHCYCITLSCVYTYSKTQMRAYILLDLWWFVHSQIVLFKACAEVWRFRHSASAWMTDYLVITACMRLYVRKELISTISNLALGNI